MSYRAIYAYAWDIAEQGVSESVAELHGLGLNTVTIAGSYHAGKFLRPHGKNGKVYFPEDGTVYFKADHGRYGGIKPVANSLLAERDVLRELTKEDLAINVWLVLMHNTLLGLAHPDACVTNAFGDRYIYNLCPSAPEARAYAIGLARDVTESYPVSGISLESPGFLPYAHGFHHEFALMKQNRWFDNLMGLCFCSHCMKGAAAAGIDAGGLRTQIRDDIESWLSSPFDLPDDMAEAFWLADTRAAGALNAFLTWRCSVVTSLVSEIKSAIRKDAAFAIIPSVARPTAGCWYEGTDLHALAKTAGIIEACFYEPSAARVRVDAWDVKRRVGEAGKLRGILRPAYPDLKSRGEVVAAVEALRDSGITDVAFYNYGHVRSASLGWIKDALAILGD